MEKRESIDTSASSIEVKYVKARMSKRIQAKIIDLFLFLVFGFLFFYSFRSLATTFPSYQKESETLSALMLDSGLYVEEDGRRVDIVTSLNKKDLSGKAKADAYSSQIDTFISFCGKEPYGNEEKEKIVQDNYDSYRLSVTVDDNNLFVKQEDGTIAVNPDSKADYLVYVDKVYQPYLDGNCKSYLVTLFPAYEEANRYLANMILFFEVPVAVLLASLLVYFVPPLIFKRNRQTIGMLIHHIGKANTELLAVPLKTYFLYSLIWNIGIVELSLFTLGIPLIISLTMMIATKTKQDFPDYMLQLYDLDIEDNQIYYSLAEAEESLASQKKIRDSFTMKKRN